MKKNVLLIGAGRFGKHMAMQLNQLGHQVMTIFITSLILMRTELTML